MKALVYLPLLAAALLLGWQLSRSTPPAPAPTQAELAPEPATQAPPVSLLRESAPDAASTPQANSLRGTEVDGRLQTDADGNLLIHVESAP